MAYHFDDSKRKKQQNRMIKYC